MTAEQKTESIVSLRGVTKHFHQGEEVVKAVDGVDLDVFKSEFTVISGPSGSGKTTILNLIGALDQPTGGDIWVEGKNILKMSRTERSKFRRDRIGFVFQAYNLIPVLTAFENAEFILALQGRPAKERKNRVYELMKDVGLEGLEDRRPDEMSGGQQQRVAIVRAIATQPAVVLADEPTANVDSKTAGTILDLMEKLNREKGATFLFSTHDHKVIERASRVIQMRDGKIEGNEIRNPADHLTKK
jgi:putative ABC transport system ATP-binding protein